MGVRAAAERIVRRFASDVTYLRVYAATVELQRNDGSCDLRTDAAELRGEGLQRVPVMSSPAGSSARVEPGTRCLVGFADGDPRKPRIIAWEYARSRAVVALDAGRAGVARNGDLVELHLSPQAPISGVITGVVQVTNPSPPPPTIPTPVVPGTQFTGFAAILAPVRGRILGGAARVKA